MSETEGVLRGYDAISRLMAVGIVNENAQDIEAATALARKHFTPTAEMTKELQVTKQLSEPLGITAEGAYRMIDDAQQEVSSISLAKIQEELRRLHEDFRAASLEPGEIDHHESVVAELFTQWRRATRDLKRIRWCERDVQMRLMESPVIEEQVPLEPVDLLVMRLMVEKLNKRYGDALNEDQRSMLHLYMLPDAESSEILSERFGALVATAREEIQRYIDQGRATPLVRKRLEETHAALEKEDTTVSDESMARFMSIANLVSEFKSKEDVLVSGES